MIELKNINKTYKTQERRFGLLGIIKDMFKPDYSEVKALTDISFKIENNENVAIVGKNGSGKSTLIKIISGILRPTSGEILFNHKNIYENQKEYKRNIGVIFGQRSQLYQNMIFRESLEPFRLIYKIEKDEANKRLNTLIDLFKLENLLKKPIREMSLGQKMKCEIALVLFHNPKILLLDEPTIGLDLEVKEQFYNLIKTYKQSNDIILILISHNSDDIINLSERLLVLNNGKLQEDIRTHEFIESYNKSKIVTLLYKKHIDLTKKLQNNFNIIDKDLQKNSISFEVEKQITMEEIFNSLDDKENIYDIKIENEDFSKILLNYYKDKKNGMKYLLGIISLNIKQHLYFKISAVFSIFSLLFLFLIKSSVWSQIGNADYISYFAIITIVSSFISVNTDRYFQTIYQTGSISFLLLRPINFGLNIFLQDFAAALTRFILKSLPLLIVLILFFDINIYHGIINLCLFIFSIFCAYLFNWFTAYIIGLCVFFYGNNEGFIQIKNILFLFFSGALIPFDFFPEVLQKILNYLPFRVLYQIPIEVLNNSNLKSFNLISKQLYWIFFLLVFTYIFHRTAIKKIEIMGG